MLETTRFVRYNYLQREKEENFDLKPSQSQESIQSAAAWYTFI